MGELVLTAIFIGNLTVTSYRPVKEQTDSTPFYTSTQEHVRAGGCAISRDLLCGACKKLHGRCRHPNYPKKLHYGDWLYVEGYSYRQINDVMGEYTKQRVNGKIKKIPIKQHIDIFVWDYEQEKSVNVKRLNAYKIKEQKQ